MWSMRPTPRGWGLLAGGSVLALAGGLWGSIDIARLGLVGPLLVLAGALWVVLFDPARGRHALRVHRSVQPNPVSAHSPATAHVEVLAGDTSGRSRLADLELGEQAASQLSGGLTLRARVERSAGRIALSYALAPVRRGRWPLGPLVARRTDPFGVVRTRSTLGEPVDVTVWPAVVDLDLPSGALVGEPDRVALGARSPSPDDAALRGYRVGDDLRRVHWVSSARRGELVVRSDERAGRRTASILLDLPRDRSGIEWSVSLATSMGLAALGGGHPVRLLGGHTTRPGGETVGTHGQVREGGGSRGRAELLDRAVDLEPAPTDAENEAVLVAAVAELGLAVTGRELVLAVVGALSARGRAALAPLADGCDAFAVVRVPPALGAARRDADVTLAALRRAGWHVCGAEPGEDLHQTWARLLETAR
ncbi:DUF58 domain-containing protein [uncultured Cellulomonas sp.]|uniref:DUF58 domain-containing protein n=1 Tax=uncultured Cellulomonas sp. TaxID=189682 RepID=UPI0026273368|nr:DUF58 domain-containing protein [uncultured Cellulomonas sp.]